MQPGILWIVATPIGNLDDLGARARDILGRVDVTAAEDTRVARRLFAALGLAGQIVSVHEHNERGVVPALLEKLAAGMQIALISDAGTPLISDPGFRLVRAAREHGIRVAPVPGPCAAVAALSVAGLPTDRFWFEGFLPSRTSARQARLRALVEISATLVFYEASRRVPDTLDDLALVLGGERPAVVARELTKQHETVLDGTLTALAQTVRADPEQQLGEAVLVVSGAAAGRRSQVEVNTLARELASELPPARAARILSRTSALSRSEAFALVEQLKAAAHGE